MAETSRICPLCETKTDDAVCAKDGVPTVEQELFAAQEEAIQPGAVISGRFRVENLLGKGAMGSVFAGVQVSMNRKVAIKTLQKGLMTDQKLVKRFYLEARAASQLEHPNIVRIFDFGIDDMSGVPYIAMEYLEGSDLGDLIKETGGFPERESCRLLAQVAKALVEAHDKGIVHRDLKPDNIHVRTLSDGEQQAKVLDFGIAKVVSGGTDSAQDLTQTGMTMGTPLYMAPEQIMGKEVDFRADLYSMGCILHQLLVGTHPYDAPDRLGVLMKHVKADPPKLPPALKGGAAPTPDLVALHDALLRKKRQHRPDSTAVIARILTGLGRGEPVGAVKLLAPPGENQSTAPMDALSTDPNAPAPAVDVSQQGAALVAPRKVQLQPDDATMVSAAIPNPAETVQGMETLVEEDLNLQGSSSKGPAITMALMGLALVVGAAIAFWPGEGTPPGDTASSVESPDKVAPAAKTEPEPEPKSPEAVEVAPVAEEPEFPLYKINVETTPTGASVLQEELLLGMTPMSITLQEGQEGRTITLSLDGYLHQQLRATRDTPSPLRVTLRRAGPQLDPRAKRLKKKKKKPSASGSTPSAPKPAPKPKKKKKKKVVPVW